ncbi:MAG: hypothetical protein ACT4OW_01925 [Nitrososphaerota archaeon]
MKIFTPKKKEDNKKEPQPQKSDDGSNKENVHSDNQPAKKKFGFSIPKISKQDNATQVSQEVSKNQIQDSGKTKDDEEAGAKIQDHEEKVDLSFAQNIKNDEKLKKLIEVMMSENTDTINPTINVEKNLLTYPILTKIGESEENVDYLEKLSASSVGIFDKEISERLIVCPHHPEDFSISIRMYCPYCSSMDIRRLHLIEHKVCGYIAEKDEYGVISVADLRTCPNCKRQIKDLKKEIRLPGNWNKCNSCDKKFDSAIVKLHCRRFDHDFDLTEVESVIIPKFKIKKDAGKNIDTLTLLSPLKKTLTAAGFIVEELSNVKGKSGISHHTDIFAHNEKNQTVAIFIKSAHEMVDDAEINSTLVNILDISPTLTIFIGIPLVSERAIAMAAAQNMMIVTGKETDKIISAVEKILSEKISISADSQLRRI